MKASRVNILGSWLFHLLFSLSEGSYWHPHQVSFVGNYFNVEKANEIDFCNKAVCVYDASRMGNWMNESANPCDNFYQYACGSLLYFQAQNDRYPFQGLQQILYENIYEQRRKVLAKPVTASDLKPQVVAKKIFQKCLDSRYINKNGKKEVLDFMKKLGGFPMVDGDSWDPSKFNRSKIFEDYPQLASYAFQINFKVKKSTEKSKLHYVVLDVNFNFYPEAVDRDILTYRRTLEAFGVANSSTVEKDLDGIRSLFLDYALHASYENPDEKKVVAISNLTNFLHLHEKSLKVDWRKILESLVDFEVSDDFQVVVINPSLIQILLQAYGSIDDRTFVNFFFLEFLLKFRQVYTLYFITYNEQKSWGLQKAQQRFEQCSKIVQLNLPVAFTSLVVRKYANVEKVRHVEEIARRTMKLIIENVAADESIPEEHRMFMSDKLNSLKLILAYPKELLNDSNIEMVYKDLELTGSESFLKLFIDSYSFGQSQQFKNLIKVSNIGVERDESSIWIDYTKENEYETPLYVLDTKNIIYYPSLWFQYPYFHQDRPRYYQDTMFATFLSYTVAQGLKDYMVKHNISSRNGEKNHFDFIELMFQKYSQWDDETHSDPPLPGFLFSNKQMFWYTLIHKNCIKLQPGYSQEFNAEPQAEAYFRETESFHRSFGCDFSNTNMTAAERHEFLKLYNEFY